jgi:transposase-like protein
MDEKKSGTGALVEGAPERSGGAPSSDGRDRAAVVADTEVQGRAQRRLFSAEYKLKIVREAAACVESGQIGALLRREGLYASMLADWRRRFEQGGEKALRSARRGPKAQEKNPLAGKVAELEREKRRLEKRLAKAEAIIDFQKKVHELLGIPLKSPDDDESDS